MTLPLQVIWLLLIILACADFCMASLNVIYEFKYIEYARDNCIDDEEYSMFMQSYDYRNNIPLDVQQLPDGRILMTSPNYYEDMPSLSTISNQTGDGGPLLAPYPNWSWHNRKDCSGLKSVHRVVLDDCNRLWVVDSGKVKNDQVCPAKILAFDPETDKLITELVIPDELTHNVNDTSLGRLQLAAVETYGKSCDKIWVYIADTEGFGLVIWDGYDIWRLNDQVYNAEPDQTDITITGLTFTLNFGVRSFYITPVGFLRNRAALFKPLASLYTYAVTLEDLHRSKSGFEITYYRADYVEPSQELAGAFSERGGILIFDLPSQTALACYNLQYPALEPTVPYLVVDEPNLQFVGGIKFTEDSQSGFETLWVLSNKYQRYATGNMDYTETNFKIMTSDVNTLVRGTICEPLAEYDVVNGIEDKGFFYYKTESDDLYKSYRLRDDTCTRAKGSISGPLEDCNCENGGNEQEEELNETPIEAPSGSCRLIRI